MINSAQWIQAKKQGVVINFKQWRDWRGLPLFGMEWYKDTVPKVTPKRQRKTFLFNLFFRTNSIQLLSMPISRTEISKLMTNSENSLTLVSIHCRVLFKIKNKAYIISLFTVFNTIKS